MSNKPKRVFFNFFMTFFMYLALFASFYSKTIDKMLLKDSPKACFVKTRYERR